MAQEIVLRSMGEEWLKKLDAEAKRLGLPPLHEAKDVELAALVHVLPEAIREDAEYSSAAYGESVVDLLVEVIRLLVTARRTLN